MKSNPTFWQKIGLHEWFVKKDSDPFVTDISITPDDIYKYIVEKFKESIQQLSFANRVVFYHEYIIGFNPEDYRDFMDNKKGIFGLIVQESVKQFYEILKDYRGQGKQVEPSSSKWVFRFVSHHEYVRGDKSFIGKLLPGSPQKEENLRITFIPRQTGIAQTADISNEILSGFTFYSEGYYEVPFREDLTSDSGQLNAGQGFIIARFEAIVPEKEFSGKKLEYMMRNDEIIVSGKEDQTNASNMFKVPTEWINSPHLRIRHQKNEGKLQVASFGEKTLVNEVEITRCEESSPVWTELPYNSRLVLNGIVGINVYKS